tara:strand:+ start:1535 stop:1942 length:408 start_codon:yes stop_codon:yes gene_type:complete
MKKTVKELLVIDDMVGVMYREDVELKNTKFGYAYGRFFDKNLAGVIKERTQDITEARITNALVAKDTGAIIYSKENPRGFDYSPDGLKKVIKAETEISEAFEAKEIEVEPYICAKENLPKKMTAERKEALTGLVI